MTDRHAPAAQGKAGGPQATDFPAGLAAPGPDGPAGRDVPAPTAIELAGVSKQFHSGGETIAAVRRVDLAIAQGEFFSMLGPSGCGKTTTMRVIAGFEEPTTGVVRLDGRDVTDVPPNKRDINMVFQSYALFPHMNVFDNVAFGLRRKKASKQEIIRRVGQMLEIVDLAGRDSRRPRELSGGQQQRVALARALVNHPKALLLDEPLGALDLKLRQAMQVELKRIQREVGITFVYVTHDQNEALTMSDRIAVMSEGAIEQLGSPREIYEHPGTRFVAGFIGTSNLLSGPVSRLSGDLAVLEPGDEQQIVVPLRDVRAPVGTELELTVRPEKISLSAEPPAADCRLRGTVTEVVYLGTSTSYSLTTATGADIVVFRQNAATADGDLERGTSVWLSWDAGHSYLIS
ncbi:MAG: ABC transporter ATP-binding protein [Streptosporangiaceae bacterium]